MGNLSPLIKSALDSFFHALEHNEMNREKDRRFTILHLDQAVGLLLKEKVKRLGYTIWKRDKTTISIYESKQILENHNPSVVLPEWTDIEDLHQLRNDVEHLGRTPSESENNFYVNKTATFIKSFCKAELQINLEDYEKEFKLEEHVSRVELPKYSQFLQESVNFLSQGNFYNSLINAYIALELKLKEKAKSVVKDSEKYPPLQLSDEMNKVGLLNDEQIEKFKNLWNLRNQIIHGKETIDRVQVNEVINEIKSIINELDKTDITDKTFEDFIQKVKIQTELDRVSAIIYGLLKINKIEKFTVNDIRSWLEKLRQPIPKNINYALIRLREKGFVEVSLEKKDNLTTWYLTLAGEKYINELKNI